MTPKIVIWDWNGTLADDLQPALHATNDILAHYHKPPISLETYYEYMESPISRFYAHFFDLNKVPMAKIGEHFAEFYPRYFEKLQDGALELLEALKAAGVRQIILSSAHRDSVERDTARFYIRKYFSDIIASDDLLASGKVARAKAWIAKQDIAPSEMVMVGDMLHDLEAAEAMGTRCILVPMGHQSKEDLLSAGVPVVDSLRELGEILLPTNKAVQKKIALL